MANTYTVKKGDTLWAIAKANGTTYQKLAEINGISNPNYLYVGQVIKLTSSGSSSSGGSSGSSSSTSTSSSKRATITAFGLQSNSDNTLFATWSWKKNYTDNYQTMWQYGTGDGVWFVGSDSTTTYKQSTYGIPSNAKHVRFRVKPISKTKTDSNGKETYYWKAEWSSWKSYNVSSSPPSTPPTPSVEIDKYKLTATIDNLDVDELNATDIKFEVVKNDTSSFKTGTVKINKKYNYVSYSCNINAGHNYKVRCKAIRGKLLSDWSDFSNNEQAIPSSPSNITKCNASGENADGYSVYLEWKSVNSATSYDIEYTTIKEYFDNAGDTTTVSTTDASTKFTIYKLGSGEYFFRIRAVNEKGSSDWSTIASVKIGEPPAAPTTWSSTTTIIVGEPLNLYWVHNAEDGSSQTFAEVELCIGDVTKTYTIENTTDEDEKDKTSVYSIDTTDYEEGVTIKWRVRTAGITKEYGDWSIQRTVDIYAPATLELTVTDEYEILEDGSIQILEPEDGARDVLEAFPFYVKGLAGPETQAPIGYHLSITSNEAYETIDQVGNIKMVNEGDEVYSKYFDISSQLLVEFSAGNIDLENGVEYTITCKVAMNSGLTAEASSIFTVSWIDMQYEPNAEISVDEEIYSVSIRPYCEDHQTIYYKVENDSTGYTATTDIVDETVISGIYTSTGEKVYIGTNSENDEIFYCIVYVDDDGDPIDPVYYRVDCDSGIYYITTDNIDETTLKSVYTTTGEEVLLGMIDDDEEVYYTIVEESTLVEDITLSVYRRDFDGGFTELATGINNTSNTYITDPHPALDYARYRIVAVTNTTGAVSYYDLPAHPVGGKAVIIQWDENWTNFDNWNEDALAQPSWSGSLLKLPYNIDVSDSNDSDVTLVKYIGRKRPVSYYGTQLGEKSSWNVVIEKDDEETIYALRRLALWSGDVYVREPSGSGYWANIKVSFSQKHCEMTIPVSLEITRVEGGV